jgi:carbonic anhydrase
MTHFPSRRSFLRLAGLAAAASFASACRPWTKEPLAVALPTPTPRGPEPIESGDALERLLTGNLRFVANYRQYPGQSVERRAQVAEGQHPFAAILTCADSRVPPELLFDQGLGDLFVVRVAGNVADDEITGSLEYAVEHLGVRLIMVLGHERCGAVRAALEAIVLKAEPEGNLEYLVRALEPAIEEASPEGDLWENAATANVQVQVGALRASKPILHEFVEKGELRVVGARYDLDTGLVSVLADETESSTADGH